MSTNRLFIYDKDTNSAICIAKGHTSGWGRIRDNYSSERWFDEIIEEYPGNLGEMCHGDTKLELKTEGSLPKTCNVLSYNSNENPSEVKIDPDADIVELQRELDKVRELNRENVGRIQAMERVIKDKDFLILCLEGQIDKNKLASFTELYDQKAKIEGMMSKLIDILHTKEKGYFD